MLIMRRAFASCLVMSLLPLAVLAQASRDTTPLALHAFAFKHQRASDAVSLVTPLLSPRGTVELQPRGNGTLVLRDTPAAIARILTVLRGFDHEPQRLQIEVLIVRASRSQTSPRVQYSDLPDQLTQRLREALPYDGYRKEAEARFGVLEGQSVTVDLNDDYQVAFRMGTLLGDGRIKLNDFQISRQSPRPAELIHIPLNLWLDQTRSLGLAKSEASREALMVVLTVKGGIPPLREVRKP
jgi:hypothetical protein